MPNDQSETTQIRVSISYDFADLPRWRIKLHNWVSVTLAGLLGAKISARKSGDA